MKRRKFTSKFKTKVVLEALKERQSLAELAQKYQLHPNQISTWKKEFLAGGKQNRTLSRSQSWISSSVPLQNIILSRLHTFSNAGIGDARWPEHASGGCARGLAG